MVKILIIRFSSIGDIVLTTPVVRMLKQQLPDTEIHFLTKPQFSILIESNPYIDKTHYLKPEFSDTITELKNEFFDYIIDLHNNLRTSRIKYKLNLPAFTFDKLNLKKWIYVNFKKNNLPDTHIVDRYLQTTTVFDIKNDNKGLDYFIPENDNVEISKSFTEINDKYISFVIGAKHSTKQLPINKIIEICNKIDLPIILMGGKEDSEKAEQIVSKAQNTYNACGGFNLNQSASILKQADAVISHDTGLMHIAAAFSKKIISIWGNTVPEFGMYPYLPNKESKIIQVNNLKCRPCSKIGFSKCPKKHFKCMEDINIEEIISTIN